jgi:membrane protein YdbS with pleckstrin-like domain
MTNVYFMAYPRRLLTDGEEVVREFRPHWRLLVIPVFWALLGIGIVIATWTYAPEVDILDWVVTGLVVVASMRYVFYPFISWWFTSYVLTNERLIRRSGILSRAGLEIPLENINDLRFSQSILERLLRSGDVLVESAGEKGQSRFADIPEPEDFHSLIYKVREVRTRDLARGGTPGKSDGMSKLERLGQLLKDGLITQEDYDAKKQSLLDEI